MTTYKAYSHRDESRSEYGRVTVELGIVVKSTRDLVALLHFRTRYPSFAALAAANTGTAFEEIEDDEPGRTWFRVHKVVNEATEEQVGYLLVDSSNGEIVRYSGSPPPFWYTAGMRLADLTVEPGFTVAEVEQMPSVNWAASLSHPQRDPGRVMRRPRRISRES